VRRVLGLLGLVLSAAATAADLTPVQSNGELGLRLEGLAYPSTLSRELESGLTNRFFVRVRLLDAQAVLQERTVEIAIRYDLWDQNFIVVHNVDGVSSETQRLIPAEMKTWLSSLPISGLFSTRGLSANRDLTVSAEVLLNPIDREKLSMIRKWVAENSTPVNADQGISVSNTVFNRIFGQYADGSELAAVWHVKLVSPPFRPGAPANERR
jgi:hypothetical protein